jgi:Ca-activated chloride channel family protein
MSRHGQMYCAAVLIAWILVLPELSAQTNQRVSGGHRLPLRIGVVIDESGSARGEVLQAVLLQKSLDWVGAALRREGGDAFLVAFNDQIIVSTELVTDVAQLRRAAQQVRQIGGSAVNDALIHTAQKFNSVQPEQQPAKRMILLISDGFDNASYENEKHAAEALHREHVRVYAVCFPSPEAWKGKKLLDNIAKLSGGKAFFPTSESDISSVLADIESDLASSQR